MKKTIYSTLMIAAGFAVSAQAQQKINLNLGDKTVQTVQLGEGDYISFGRPEGVLEVQPVEITGLKAGKNYIKYTVETTEAGKPFYQMWVAASWLDMYMQQYMGGLSLSTASDNDFRTAFRTLLLSDYGSGNYAPFSYSFVDGEEDEYSGETSFVPGGQKYYVAACDLDMVDGGYQLGSNMTYTTVTTEAPGASSEQLDVKFEGMNDDGQAYFSVQPGSNIKTLYMTLGSKKSIDEFLNVYGYDYLMFTQSTKFTADQWNELKQADKLWNIDTENDYSFYVLGVDGNGDWVKAQVENVHLKPNSGNSCPVVDVANFQCIDGQLAIQYNVKSEAAVIKSAHMLIMDESAWDNALNEYKYEKPSMAWAEYMDSNPNTTDVTEVLKALGNTFTFKRTFSEEERGWYVAVLAVTDENGTTVTRTSFHTHLDNAEPETISHTYPKTSSTQAETVAAKLSVAKAKKLNSMTGRISVKAKQSITVQR